MVLRTARGRFGGQKSQKFSRKLPSPNFFLSRSFHFSGEISRKKNLVKAYKKIKIFGVYSINTKNEMCKKPTGKRIQKSNKDFWCLLN